jgi:hypothetical protein
LDGKETSIKLVVSDTSGYIAEDQKALTPKKD